MINNIDELLSELSRKAGVSELIINKGDSVYIEKDGDLIRLDARFTHEEIDRFANEAAKLNHKNFGPDYPVLDGILPDGSRINVIHKNYTGTSHAITIRRYSQTIKKFESSPGIFGLSADWVEFLKTLVKAKMNIVISGGTAVGKTSLLNLLLQEISLRERVITIEDTRELQFGLPDVVRLEAKPVMENGLTIRDLVKNTLRMRPDRIVVGEVRGAEVFDLLQAMNSGHEGCMTSVHANSPGECISRLENLYFLAGFDVPLRAIRYQLNSAIDFIIQIRKEKDGSRIVSQVTEISGMEGDRILQQDVGVIRNGKLQFTGLVPSVVAKLQEAGLSKEFFIGT